jgi:hypothetical protein
MLLYMCVLILLYVCVLMLLCMCVLMLLYMCADATTELLVLLQFLMPDFFDPTDEVQICPILLFMCPRTYTE